MPASAPSSGSSWRSLVILSAAVLGVVLAVHWPVLSAGALVFDDLCYLFLNPILQQPGWESAKVVLTEVVDSSTIHGYYEPLTLISLMLDVARGGRTENLSAFHATSLGLHLLNTLLVLWLIQSLFRKPWVAALVALLFGLHPLTVEPVAWVWERKTVLATFFGLLSILLYVHYARRSRISLYCAALMLFVPALMSKPTVTLLPILLLILDFWPLRRLNRRAVLEKLPFLGVAAISAIVTVISAGRTSGVWVAGEHSPLEVPLRMAYLVAFYLAKVAWPANLSPLYVLPVPMSPANPMVLGAACGTLVMGAAVVASLRWTRVAAAGGLFFLVTILPTLGIIGYSWITASDKYVYMPLIGLALATAGLLDRVWERASWRPAIVTAALIVCFAEAVGVRLCLERWQDSETLALHIVRLAPGSAMAHNNLATALVAQERLDEAIEHYSEAIRLEPGLVQARSDLACVLLRRGRSDAAISACAEAIRLNPTYADAHRNMGDALAAQGNTGRAEQSYREAIHLKPVDALAHNNLGLLLAAQGRMDEAAACYVKAMRISPGYAEAYGNLGDVFATRGDFAGATQRYTEALRLRPLYPQAHSNLGYALASQGRLDEAVAHYREAIRLNPALVQTRCNLGAALLKMGKPEEAGAHYTEAIRLRPDYAEAHSGLAGILENSGSLDAAVEHYRKAIQLRPNWAIPRRGLATTLQKLGRTEEAAAESRQAERLDRQDSGARQPPGPASRPQGS